MPKTPRTPSSSAVRPCTAVRYSGTGGASHQDHLAVEEPLEIRLSGEALAITMRTPGDDRELALGFLLSEGIIGSAREVGSASHCGHLGQEGYGNVLDVLPGPGTAFDVDAVAASRRATLTTAACGVCGRRSVDDLLARTKPVLERTRWMPQSISALPAVLRAHQTHFDWTGGLHAAAVFDTELSTLAVYEDVGRHNAVDKCLGRLLLDRRLGSNGLALAVSGRTSFEIVHKAVIAGIGLVVGVSAASSLAVHTAERAGVTLVGFTRGDAFNVYSHAERIA